MSTMTVPYRAPAPVQQWLCKDTVAELRGWDPRVIETRSADMTGVLLTWSDFMAGAGGSMKGFISVPGMVGRIAVNHWPLAVETHNYNMPDVDHDVCNVARADPRRYPSTDCAWFSPECTQWSLAAGRKCEYDESANQMELFAVEDEDDTPAAKLSRWRSRMLMRDVVRFSRHHRYKAVIVENVPDILKWVNFHLWLAEMSAEGYDHKVLTLNSAFAHALGEPAPQLRDRVYVVFWQRRYRRPNFDKWLRVAAWCPSCADVVMGIWTAKPGPRRPMRYDAQYFYRCPKTRCKGVKARPYVLPAAAAIDWSLPAQRIGDRKTPLAAKTRARIEAGLRRYACPITAEVAGHTYERSPGVRTWPVDRPLTAQTTTATKAVACPPLLVPAGGTYRDAAATVDRPMATRTTIENDAIVVPPFLTVLRSDRPRTVDLGGPLATVVADGSNHALVEPMVVSTNGRDRTGRARGISEPLAAQTARREAALVVPLRNNGVARPAGQYPLVTLAAGGEHAALVMRNNTARGDGGQMSTPVNEPMRTVLAEQRQSLVRWDHLLYQYDTGHLRPLTEPLPTQTTVDGDAVVGPSISVDDCTLRMLAVHEIQFGMAFPSDFVLLGSAKRDKVRMLGNAVTPPAARDLAACVAEAVTGVEFDPVDLGLVRFVG